MEAKAIANTVRVTPRKARLVLDLIRGKSVGDAYAMLRLTPKAACEPVSKVLLSAVANAEHNLELKKENFQERKNLIFLAIVPSCEQITTINWMYISRISCQ